MLFAAWNTAYEDVSMEAVRKEVVVDSECREAPMSPEMLFREIEKCVNSPDVDSKVKIALLEGFSAANEKSKSATLGFFECLKGGAEFCYPMIREVLRWAFYFFFCGATGVRVYGEEAGKDFFKVLDDWDGPSPLFFGVQGCVVGVALIALCVALDAGFNFVLVGILLTYLVCQTASWLYEIGRHTKLHPQKS